MDTLWHDLRYAARQLLRSPGFTAVAVLTLALGIGANTAIFSVVDTVMLKPLAYESADRLVEVMQTNSTTGERNSQLSLPNFLDLAEQSRSFSELGAFRFYLFTLSGGERAETFLGLFTSSGIFQSLGVRFPLGRGFLSAADRKGAAPELILSYEAWSRRYAQDPRIIGRSVTIDGTSATVVGVLPKAFRFPSLAPANAPLPSREPALYLNLGRDPEGFGSRGNDNYWVIGRLASGATEARAIQEVRVIAGRLKEGFRGVNDQLSLDVTTLQHEVIGDARRPLLVLLGAVGLVLLVSCTNVAGLMVARAAGRRREFALRAALGATRARLTRQLLTESVLLSLLGGCVGLLIAMWGIQAIRVTAPNSLPRLSEVVLDSRMLGFTLLVSLTTGIVFGLSPAMQGSEMTAADVLKDGGRGSAGGARRRLRGVLVVSEVALSMVLLAGAGLLLRSFVRVLGTNPGFDGRNVITMLAILPGSRYPDARKQVAFTAQALQRIQALSDVEAAGVVNTLPLSNLGGNTSFKVAGQPEPAGGAPSIPYRLVAGNYFDALRIHTISGRIFSPADSAGAPLVAMLSEAAVRRYFPGENPLGRALQLGNDSATRVVIGVLQDIHEAGLDQPAVAEVYYPFAQGPDPVFTLVVRTKGEPHASLPSIEAALASVDPDQAVFLTRTMSELASSTLENRRFQLGILGSFALSALALAALGLYGVVSYSVAQRTREIGIRVALGASRRAVLRLLLREGLVLALIGTGVGLAGALVATRALASQLVGVTAFDPAALGGVAALLLAVALLASLIPARRATSVDPMVALRSE